MQTSRQASSAAPSASRRSAVGKCVSMDAAYCQTVVWEPQRSICQSRAACSQVGSEPANATAAAVCALVQLCSGSDDSSGDAAGTSAACAACLRRAAAALDAPDADVCGAAAPAPGGGAVVTTPADTTPAAGGADSCLGVVTSLQRAAADCGGVVPNWPLFDAELGGMTSGAPFSRFCAEVNASGAPPSPPPPLRLPAGSPGCDRTSPARPGRRRAPGARLCARDLSTLPRGPSAAIAQPPARGSPTPASPATSFPPALPYPSHLRRAGAHQRFPRQRRRRQRAL